jgi:hypothetical protein
LLYLRGLSTGDFVPALGAFFGSEAGLSASTVQRLTVAWQAEQALARAQPGRRRLCVPVGGWHPLQRPPRGRPPVLPRAGGRAPGRHQGTGGGAGRVPRGHAVVAGPAAGSQAARDDGARAGDRRWRARLLGGVARGVPRHPRAAVLVPLCGAADYVDVRPGCPCRRWAACRGSLHNHRPSRKASSASGGR